MVEEQTINSVLSVTMRRATSGEAKLVLTFEAGK
jgi:hypothetical protein